MKKLSLSLFAAFAAVAIYSCSPEKGNSAESDPHVIGYSVDSSANIDVIKASFKDMVNYDTANYKLKYVDTAVFHDNLNKMTLSENVALVNQMKSAGLTIKVDEINSIWEEKLNKPKNGIQNFVFSFSTISWTKAGKTVTVIISQVDAFNKEGKIVEEWLTYDTSAISELLK